MTEITEKIGTNKRYYTSLIKLRVVKEKKMIYEKPLKNSREVAKFATSLFSGLDREYVYAVFVDSKSKINAVENISIGSLNRSVVEPREVFKSAILNNSASLFLLHNHPSGECTPSKEDIMMTKRIKEVGKLLGIDLKDHIIIGDDKFYSFEEEEEETLEILEDNNC